jgi:hypothetical protein
MSDLNYSYYFEQRIVNELGLTDEHIHIDTVFDNYDWPYRQQVPMVTPNSKKGGLDLLYVGLHGVHSYTVGKKEKPYIRTRLHPNQVKDGYKYHTPKGAGTHIFIPPLMHRLFRSETPIDTLVVTEGEIKVLKACMHGLPCVGIQGIHNFYEKIDGKNVLNTELERIIISNKVKNVIFLLDADALDVTYAEDKDLYKRPNLMYTSVRNFRECTKHLNIDLYFGHILPESKAKGLDDLLVLNAGDESTYIDDLLLLHRSKLFSVQNITDKSLNKLREYFHINTAEAFYSYYEEIIGDKRFIFNQRLYQHNGDQLEVLVDAAINNYIRVGDEYFEKIQKPDKDGKLVTELEKRKRTTITDDYGKIALQYVKKYKSFCLVPSHTNYQQVVGQCYNTYQQLDHILAAGSIDTTLKMLNRVFGDKIDFILDWIQLLYLQPTQNLPILCLVSTERNTGKSTVGQWLIDLLQLNAVKLGNADLDNSFNSHYAEKLLLVVDETAIEKRVTSEAIKRMSTERGKIFVNAKNRNQYPVDYIGKFVFISNDEERFMYIGKGESRFAVFKVPVLTEDDVEMLEKLREEIPAFLHFLQNRTLVHSRQSRMYFDFSVYKTKHLDTVIDASLSRTEKALRELIVDTFDMFPDAVELYFAPSDIFQELNKHNFIDETSIKNCLKVEFKMDHVGQMRYMYHSLKDTSAGEIPIAHARNGKPYRFLVENFLAPEEVSRRLGKATPEKDPPF